MLTCTCNEYFERAEDFKSTMRRARKQHTCCECGSLILPGECYEHITMRCYEEWIGYYTCVACATIADTFQSCGRIPTTLWEDIHEGNCLGDAVDDDFCICPKPN